MERLHVLVEGRVLHPLGLGLSLRLLEHVVGQGLVLGAGRRLDTLVVRRMGTGRTTSSIGDVVALGLAVVALVLALGVLVVEVVVLLALGAFAAVVSVLVLGGVVALGLGFLWTRR